ncbi:MAG TPA: glycosyl hydrolase family 28-related protein [Verrucomicrobiae bacterium]|jgi:polygalacturonase
MKKILFLFISLLSAVALQARPTDNIYDVRHFGAHGDGKHLDTPAINKAIARAAAAGGGTVLIPAGTYLCGSIHLQSNIHLLIDTGATILGAPQDLKAYDAEEDFTGPAYQDGGHTYFHNSLIWGENLTNVFITGNGTINGGGLVREDGMENKIDHAVDAEHTNDIPIGSKSWPQHLGNKAIALKLCRNVLIRDITIYHGGHFAIITTGCENLTIDNVTIDTDRDGMDIDCCKNTMISNCRVNSPRDDGICPKASYALGRPFITENLAIVNCEVSGFKEGTLIDGTMVPTTNGTGRIKFGTEASCGFRNCTVANCTFTDCHGFALEEVDGATLEDITVNNLTMRNVLEYAIYLTTGKRDRTPGLTTTSHMRNILISNVIADGVGKMSGIQICGLPESPIQNVRLDGIRLISNGGGTTNDAARTPKELGTIYPEPSRLGILPAYGVFARHVQNLELANISTSFETNEMRPAMICSDVNGLQIDNFRPQVADGVLPAKFDNVTGLEIRNSPALENKTAAQ